MPTTILASRYNTLRDNVNLVLGISSSATPTYGYGQPVSTNGVLGTRAANDPVNADKVSAQDYEDLYIDILRCRAHQIGAANVTVNDFVVGDYDTNLTNTDKIEETYIQTLEGLASTILSDRFTVDPLNLDITANLPSASSSRPQQAWNGTISHIFTMTWPSAASRRHFFNAGGEIRFSAGVNYTGSQAKTVDWQTILAAMGSTSFKATNTVNNSGVGSGSNIGNHDLTSSYQLAYSRTGGAVYSRNRYYIYAKEYATGDSTSAIQFKVDFVDGAPNNVTYGIDESVFGEFYSNVGYATPDSSITINGQLYSSVANIVDPTGTNITGLS